MLLQGTHRIGRMAMLLALADENESPVLSIPKRLEVLYGESGFDEFAKGCCSNGNSG